MITSINDTHIDFSIAAARMSKDMGIPLEDCKRYASLIDEDFADKLIAFAITTGQKITVKHGYRPLSYQDKKAPNNRFKWDAKLPKDGGTILQQCDCWKGGNGRLAPPGKSLHMCGTAVDVGGKLANATQLKEYGLCKPVKNEPWHVEPIMDRPEGYGRYDLAVELGMPFVWGKVKKGDKGVTVCQIQQALQKHQIKLTVDGIFGDRTVKAVKLFQAKNGLKADGIAGAKTLKALGLNP